jgi:hypothetical protein
MNSTAAEIISARADGILREDNPQTARPGAPYVQTLQLSRRHLDARVRLESYTTANYTRRSLDD